MRPWIYGVLLLVMVGLPTIVPPMLRRAGKERPDGYVAPALEQWLRPVAERASTRRGRAVARAILVLVAVGSCVFTGWIFTQPRPSRSANQMDPPFPGLPPWIAYPLGAILPLGSMWWTERDSLRAILRTGHSRPAKLDAPHVDGGWKAPS